MLARLCHLGAVINRAASIANLSVITGHGIASAYAFMLANLAALTALKFRLRGHCALPY
jgi:hypothetical protein